MVKGLVEGEKHLLEAKLAYCVMIYVCINRMNKCRSNAVTHTRWVCGINAARLGFDFIV